MLSRVENTEAAALVVIERSTITGARVGSTVEVCVRQASRSMVPPAFCKPNNSEEASGTISPAASLKTLSSSYLTILSPGPNICT